MLQRAVTNGVPAHWVTGDEVHARGTRTHRRHALLTGLARVSGRVSDMSGALPLQAAAMS